MRARHSHDASTRLQQMGHSVPATVPRHSLARSSRLSGRTLAATSSVLSRSSGSPLHSRLASTIASHPSPVCHRNTAIGWAQVWSSLLRQQSSGLQRHRRQERQGRSPCACRSSSSDATSNVSAATAAWLICAEALGAAIAAASTFSSLSLSITSDVQPGHRSSHRVSHPPEPDLSCVQT